MLRRLCSTLIQCRGLKNQVKINWVRPEFIPSYKVQRSGDLEGLPPIHESAIGLDYSLTEEIKDAPEPLKKILSVAHLGRQEYNRLVTKELTERVRRHQYDERTAETRIAKMTAKIRCYQYLLDIIKNKQLKVRTQELIDKRKQLLKFLRMYDYKKFEWLLEKLNIEYKAHPETYHKLTRKESLRKLTEIHCDNVRNSKLSEYKNLLEAQQGPFLMDKLEALKFIKSEQTELKLPITVTEKDIRQVEKQLEEWTIKDQIKQQAKKKRKTLAVDMD